MLDMVVTKFFQHVGEFVAGVRWQLRERVESRNSLPINVVEVFCGG